MKVLITGGAGKVAEILRPALDAHHECTWLDRCPRAPGDNHHVKGDIFVRSSISNAMAGKDAVIQLIMANLDGEAAGCYDVHVRGMTAVLEAAVEHRVSRVIYASTMSIYYHNRDRYFESEDEIPDALDVYGLTKQLGEQVCRTFSVIHDWMSILALRMVVPCGEEKWETRKNNPRRRRFATGPGDLRSLYLAALALNGHRGFDAVNASSDMEGKHLNMTKAKTLLGWAPQRQ